MNYDLLIQDGTIIRSDDILKSDLMISEGKIADIRKADPFHSFKRIINAKGKYVIPGGIDPHVHMCLPTAVGYSSDDFRTGSIAALYGGTTTIIDFVTPQKEQCLIDAFKQRKLEANPSYIDYSFHVSPVDLHEGIENEMKELMERGITSFKVYMAYKDSIGLDDDTLLEVMKILSKYNGLLLVHAETGDEIEQLRNDYAADNCLSPKYHALSRPAETESNAIKKLIGFCEETGCRLYIVHVSSEESIALISDAQERGLPIFAETCPQYLILDDSKLRGPFKDTTAYVFSPPLRKISDNDALWTAMKSGHIQTIGTDHCPFNFEQKEIGKDDFRNIPNGAGGVEHRLSILFSYGVLKQKIDLRQFVSLSSTNAAKIFGLYPQKGEIKIGSDADIVIWDPYIFQTINTSTHHQNCNLNIYDGIKMQGVPEIVIKNGEIVLEKNMLYLENIQANFLKRKL
jgi:dihydropyrimidinase